MPPIDTVLGKLTNVQPTPGGSWFATCPAHDDKTPSLSIAVGDNGCVLLKCHAGCTNKAILEAIGLELKDLYDNDGRVPRAGTSESSRTAKPSKPRKTWPDIDTATHGASKVWTYADADGIPIYWVARFDDGNGKRFFPYHKTDAGIVCGDPPAPLPLYRLPSLADAETVLVTEGEKCADLANGIGLTATTSAHGSKSASKTDWTPLAGKQVVILPDNDAPGRNYAQDVANILATLNPPAIVRVLDLPDLPPGGDIEEFIEARDSRDSDQIRRFIEALASDIEPFKPTGTVSEDDPTKDAGDGKAKKTIAGELVDLALSAGAILWHDGDGEPYVTIPIADHLEHCRVTAKKFKWWLGKLFYDRTNKAPSAQPMQDALNVLAGKAVHDGDEHKVFTRYAATDDAVFLDMADEQRRAIRVTPYGWTVESIVPVRFIRPRGIMPLPVPVTGGTLDDLRPFINAADDRQWILLVAWLVGATMPDGPYPVLELDGEQGSGKSTAARMLRRIIDPNKADIRSAPRDEGDLIIAARNGHICAFDNLSGCPVWLSDALCRLASGTGFGKRMLFTDADELLFSGARPVSVNGIGGVSSRADLLDRTVRVLLPTITERRNERALWAGFTKAHPAILGALLDATVVALKRVVDVHLDDPPRMADFARWVVAAEPALPWQQGAFVAAYADARAKSDQDAIEASAIGPVVLEFLEARPTWEGKAGQLLEALNESRGDSKPPKGWPTTATTMSKALRRIAPPLRAMGYGVEFGDASDRTIRLANQSEEANRRG